MKSRVLFVVGGFGVLVLILVCSNLNGSFILRDLSRDSSMAVIFAIVFAFFFAIVFFISGRK